MIATELEEIRTYWNKKYPFVDIRLWSNEEESQFYGQMSTAEGNHHFSCSTIGELISNGELFLRRVNGNGGNK